MESIAMLPHVFDHFTRAEQSLDRSQGALGIGLALVRSLVEMHRGSVTAESEGLGAGSEFIVRLPVVEVTMGEEELSPPRDDRRRQPRRYGRHCFAIRLDPSVRQAAGILGGINPSFRCCSHII